MISLILLSCFLHFVASQFGRQVDLQRTGCEEEPVIPVNGFFREIPIAIEDEVSTAQIEYFCTTGFELVGKKYNLCRNGLWTDDTAPSCFGIFCSSPPLPADGSYRPVNPFSMSPVRYYCNFGLHLEGPRVNFCKNGLWHFREPPRCVFRTQFDICRRIRCVRNAMCRNGVCRCRSGYSGHGRRRCVKSCSSPPFQEHALAVPIQEEYRHNQYLSYACEPGYKLTDPSKTVIRCNAGIFFQVTVRFSPTCSPSLCSDPQVPEYGGTSPLVTYAITWNEGDVVDFFCDPGFRLVGNRRLVCLHSDSFLDAPVCVDNCQPIIYPNSNIFPGLPRYGAGEEITYRCNPGFAPIDGVDPVHVCRNGFFVGVPPNCILRCDPPQMPINGFFSPANQAFYFFGEVVTYQCIEGYGLVGSRTTECRNRTSFAQTPTCQRLAVCFPPVAPINGMISPADRPTWRSGDVVTYSCNEGYHLMGPTTATCQDDTTFDNRAPQCVVTCAPPVTPQNGSISPLEQEVWLVGDVVTFSCDDRFLLVGEEMVTCEERSSFVNRTTCLAITCDAPTAPTNGFITPINLTTWLSGDVASFSCNDNYTLNGTQNITCTNDGVFENFTNQCLVVCSPPVAPQNGSITPGNQTRWIEGDDVTFACDSGFRFLGNASTVTCLEPDSFVDRAFCEAITCEAPTAPTNGFISPINLTTWLSGDVASFSCNDNYTLNGTQNITCTEDGVFENFTNQCLVVCTPPIAPQNGLFEPSNQMRWLEGDVVTFECEEGFRLVGNETITCLEPSSFVGQVTCEVITCELPMAPLNGFVSPINQSTWLFGESAMFNCDDDYLLVGTESVQCTEDGLFETFENECLVICLPPSPPNNGSITPSNRSMWLGGDAVTYSCDEGFRLVGNVTHQCMQSNSFVNNEVTCAVICTPPIAPTYGLIFPPNQSEWIEGDNVTYQCNDGFQLVGREYVTCLERNSFAEEVTCEEIESSGMETCLPPLAPSNGRIEPSNQTMWMPDDEVLYICELGFVLEGNEIRVCGRNGRFNGTQPECVGEGSSGASGMETCLPPLAPSNGRIEPNNQTVWMPDDEVLYICELGFVLEGNEIRVCGRNGRFNGTQPECVALEPSTTIGCPRPRAPLSGRFEPTNRRSWMPGDVVTYFCNDNFTLVGSNVSMCQEDDFFDNTTPECVEDTDSIIEPVISFGCLPPVAPSNGGTTPQMQTWNTGDAVNYFCNDNFTLVGASNATCLSNGQYNRPIPECIATCPLPTAPSNGHFEPSDREVFLSGDKLTFSCHNNTMLIGLDVVTCTNSHVFEPPPPVCLELSDFDEGSG